MLMYMNCTCMKKRYRGRKEIECIYVLAMGATWSPPSPFANMLGLLQGCISPKQLLPLAVHYT